MAVVIVCLIAATIAVAAFIIFEPAPPPVVRFDPTPDRPRTFSGETSWIALRTTDSAHVLAALGIEHAEPANWASGLSAVFDDQLMENYVFVSPPIDGWTLVVSRGLPVPLNSRRLKDMCTPLVQSLGGRFLECQYFASYRSLDLYAWLRMASGDWLRAYAITDTGVAYDDGAPDRFEKSLGLSLFDVRGLNERSGDVGGAMLLYPKPEHVMRIAAQWSLDPRTLATRDEAKAGVGWAAPVPRAWHARTRSDTQLTSADTMRPAA